MRVYCKVCGQRGRITKTNRLSDDVSDLYCQCNRCRVWPQLGVYTIIWAYFEPIS